MNSELDRCAPAYQEDFAYSLDNRLILNWYPRRVLRLASGDSMLDLGLGHGFTVRQFSERFERYTVIDGSPEIIRQFREKYPDVRVDIRPGSFEDFHTEEKFDNIVMGFVLEHVDNPAAILRRFRRYLKPGGSIFVSVPNAEALNKRLGYAAGMIDSLMRLSPADELLGHQRLFTVASLSAMVELENFNVKGLEGLFLKPITTRQIQTLQLSEPILQAMLEVGVGYPELCVGILMQLEPRR
jgi:2-polyprenyl-3-methyl-5-hydroxy-6-metoxy-1,4-benzoquinol methylase